jgi:hypothetical protein
MAKKFVLGGGSYVGKSYHSFDRLARALNNRGAALTFDKVAAEKGHYNCWGFTAHALGWSDRLYWMDNITMEDFLDDLTVPVPANELPQIGDIAVFIWDGYLTHTAIVGRVNANGDHHLWHKPGVWDLQYESLTSLYAFHRSTYGKVTEYRRPV